jgi:hypothetical protein
VAIRSASMADDFLLRLSLMVSMVHLLRNMILLIGPLLLWREIGQGR